MERVCIYIDASNFYHLALKKLNITEVDFDHEKFACFLAQGRRIGREGKRFYVGTVRERQDGHETTRAISNQTKLFSGLINAGGWKILASKLRTRQETIKVDERVSHYRQLVAMGIKEITYSRSREKGIDVKLGIDLMVGAIDNQYDTAIVVSSDGDLIPAIDWVRLRARKRVEYIGFSIAKSGSHESTHPTKAFIYKTDVQRVLAEIDVRQFVKTKLV